MLPYIGTAPKVFYAVPRGHAYKNRASHVPHTSRSILKAWVAHANKASGLKLWVQPHTCCNRSATGCYYVNCDSRDELVSETKITAIESLNFSYYVLNLVTIHAMLQL